MTDETPIDYDSILPRPDGEESFERKAERLIDASLERLKTGTAPKQPCSLCDTCSDRLADIRGSLSLIALLLLHPDSVTPDFRERIKLTVAGQALREVKRWEKLTADAEPSAPQ